MRFGVGYCRVFVREYLENLVQSKDFEEPRDTLGRVDQNHLPVLSCELGEVSNELADSRAIDVVDPSEVDHDVRRFVAQDVLQCLREKLGALSQPDSPLDV